ncbi:13338_t:CDS:2 [Funneliformis mosseae]|uniref:13338_t:CDS:1 n=1 Tax=Funneliformis mosseae TaxID=27381 RepID=A0A9N9G5K0_FUNMO|nr:13338_t:CDS:2 [Funneliformis mosseae]
MSRNLHLTYAIEATLVDNLYKILTWKTSEEVFGCLNVIILPKYRDDAWSKKYLIAEDIIPPPQLLQKHSSFGKPNADRFKHDVFVVYKWLDYENSHEVTAKYLILNREPGEGQYVNPMLARYPNMLRGAAREPFRELTANPNNPIFIRNIQNIQPNSMRILLRYLYGQDIDDAIQRRDSINVWNRRTGYETYNNSNVPLYKDLLSNV